MHLYMMPLLPLCVRCYYVLIREKVWKNFDANVLIYTSMHLLTETVREKALDLVAQAYSSITIADFAQFVGLPLEQAANGK